MRPPRPPRGLLSSVPFRAYWLRTGQVSIPPGSLSGGLLPLIFVFLILVLFLLPLFSTSTRQSRVPGYLPTARHSQELEQAPVIYIVEDQIILQGHQITRSGELAERLNKFRKTWSLLHPNRTFSPEIVIVADRKLPYLVLRKVMQTVAAAGYPRFQLAVVRSRIAG